MGSHVYGEISNFWKLLFRVNRFALKYFCLIRCHVNCQFREMYVDRKRSIFQSFCVACITDPFSRSGIQNNVIMPREVRVFCTLATHIQIVFDIAFCIIKVGYHNSLQGNGTSFSGWCKLAPDSGIRGFRCVCFAAWLHYIMNP